MRLKQMIEVLHAAGFTEGRRIANSQSQYIFARPNNFVVFRAAVWARQGCLLRQADLDLTRDASLLKAGAQILGTDLFVLEKEPVIRDADNVPILQRLRRAVWFTQIHRQAKFSPFREPLGRPLASKLKCMIGTWWGEPAYEINAVANADAGLDPLSGASVRLLGPPPSNFHRTRAESIWKGPQRLRRDACGTKIHPLLRQRSGYVDLIWFDNGAAIPTALYQTCLRREEPLTYYCDREQPIRIFDNRVFAGLIWPAHIRAPQIAVSALAFLVPAEGRRRFG